MRQAIKKRKVAEQQWLRATYFILGVVCTITGIIGFIVPLMPGTIFLIMAAYFFARSSERFLDYILTNKLFGHHIQNFVDGGKMPLRAKIVTAGLIFISVLTGILLF
ncbi:MAG: hypothetical protein AMXMBFR48_10650 [Ignavibacteriales bacterium]